MLYNHIITMFNKMCPSQAIHQTTGECDGIGLDWLLMRVRLVNENHELTENLNKLEITI